MKQHVGLGPRADRICNMMYSHAALRVYSKWVSPISNAIAQCPMPAPKRPARSRNFPSNHNYSRLANRVQVSVQAWHAKPLLEPSILISAVARCVRRLIRSVAMSCKRSNQTLGVVDHELRTRLCRRWKYPMTLHGHCEDCAVSNAETACL